MRSLLGSFTSKLVLSLALLIIGVGLFSLTIALMTTKQHLEAVDQSLNAGVAASIRDSHVQGQPIGQAIAADSAIFLTLMQLNPNAEIYLLDGNGVITSHAAPPGKVAAKAVAIEPLMAFIGKTMPLPIYGDDPRHPGKAKVFSAAPITRDNEPAGFVYVVLGGDAYTSALGMFRRSYVLRLSTGLILGSVVLALALGVFSFYRLTAPLRDLTHFVGQYEPQGETSSAVRPGWKTDDEIGQLARSFESMAQRIEAQVRMLRQSDQTRREFMMHVSHDLKTPIATIQGYLETLLMKWSEMDQDQRNNYISSSLNANNRIFAMVEAIFELSALEGSEVPLHCETFSAAELVQDICQKLQLEAERADVTLAVNWQHPNVYVTGDIRLIERALVNVIENAIKYSGGSSKVEIDIVTAAGKVVIATSNQGLRIDPSELEKIFIPFYRGKEAAQSVGGQGLGLSISRRIAELHGGSISASTANGRTVFTIELAAAADLPPPVLPAG